MGRRQNRKKLTSPKKIMLLIAAGLILFLVFFVFKKCVDSSGKRTHAEVVQEANNSPVLQSEELNEAPASKTERTLTQSRYDQIARNKLNSSFFIRAFKWFLRNIIFFILIAAILFLFVPIQSLIQKNKELSRELKDIKQKLAFTPSWSDLQERFLEKSKFAEFISESEKRFLRNKNNEPIDPKSGVDSLNQTNGTAELSDITEKKFFPPPYSGGYFQSNLGSKNLRPGEHILVFEFVGANHGQAKNRVDDDRDSMNYAIIYNNAILNAACEIENLMFQNPSRIENVTPGEVIKQGDDWKIVKKAVIRYE